MDIITVFFIISVAVAGTSFLTWVPAYRKGVRDGVRAEKNRVKAARIKIALNAAYGKVVDVNSLHPSRFVHPAGGNWNEV